MLNKSNFDVLQGIVFTAGEAIMKYHRSSSINVTIKNDDTPVTKADIKSNDIISKGLYDNFPEIPIISEESINLTPFEERKNWISFWLVDPLDGTKEFINGSNEFVTMIALIKKNKPVLGLIYQPTTQQGVYAEKGYGCFSFQGLEKRIKINTSFEKSGDELRSLISKNHASKEESFIKSRFPNHNHQFNAMGSGLKFITIALGYSDIYLRLGQTYEWDTAAGQIILEESNFNMVGLENNTPIVYNKKDLKNNGFICYPKVLKS